MSPARRLRCQLLAGAAAVCLVAAGCSSVSPPLGELFGNNEASKAMPAVGDGPKFTVEFHSKGASPERVELPLQDVMFVQQALERCGALKRFGRFDIEIYRRIPGQAGYHKLDVNFDRGHRRVPPEFDYALRPGDRLVISENTGNIVEDMLDAVSRQLGVWTPK